MRTAESYNWPLPFLSDVLLVLARHVQHEHARYNYTCYFSHPYPKLSSCQSDHLCHSVNSISTLNVWKGVQCLSARTGNLPLRTSSQLGRYLWNAAASTKFYRTNFLHQLDLIAERAERFHLFMHTFYSLKKLQPHCLLHITFTMLELANCTFYSKASGISPGSII